VIGMEGGTPEKIVGDALLGTWSPDGNYLYYQSYQKLAPGLLPGQPGDGGVIVDVRTGKKSLVPSSKHKFGFWLTQNTLIARNIENGKFQIFDLKTQKWTDFAPGILGNNVAIWRLSPDGRYLYYTGGAEPKVFRLRFADQRVETITSLKDLHQVVNDWQLSLAPDGSPIFTRDTGHQEIYALNIRWP
jgi:WD40-like Beta Propeller Repeat